jgi:GNAT superfamily N-acetyltransferase
MSSVTVSVHNTLPPDAAGVDSGLDDANHAAAPLAEVQPLCCLAHDGNGRLVGGAVGRSWGRCCELQQLWVRPASRRQGVATRLVQAFEACACERGCTLAYLETFSFQAPALYLALGYAVSTELKGFPQGIVKYLLVKHLPATSPRHSR